MSVELTIDTLVEICEEVESVVALAVKYANAVGSPTGIGPTAEHRSPQEVGTMLTSSSMYSNVPTA
jgi:hypothetical protein